VLRAARLGKHTWPVVRDLVDGVVTISDAEIVAAMQLLFERMKLVVEPSGAAGLAAVLSKGFAPELAKARAHADTRATSSDCPTAAAAAANGSQEQQQQLNVGVILCGGNLDFKDFWKQDNWQPYH
jgi:serine racemase